MVKPGGTGTPRLVISARFAPFPPSSIFMSLVPSAAPPPKKYTDRVRAPLPFPASLAGRESASEIEAGEVVIVWCGSRKCRDPRGIDDRDQQAQPKRSL